MNRSLEVIVLSGFLLDAVGPYAFEFLKLMPMTFLTFGLAGVVWSLWGHGKWLKEKF